MTCICTYESWGRDALGHRRHATVLPAGSRRNETRRVRAMRVAIAGGHGQIALRLAKILSQRGDEVVALIRNPDHAGDVRQAGAEPAVVDVGRYVIVSSMGADPDLPGDDTFSVYQRAKGRADDAVRASGLDATVVRPGGLTNDPGTGRVNLGESVPRGQVTRDDVAAVLAAVLDSPNTIGRTVDLVGGETPVAEAVKAI
jgi:uncharacterized protein YbjT (DUF2867 family)